MKGSVSHNNNCLIMHQNEYWEKIESINYYLKKIKNEGRDSWI